MQNQTRARVFGGLSSTLWVRNRISIQIKFQSAPAISSCFRKDLKTLLSDTASLEVNKIYNLTEFLEETRKHTCRCITQQTACER